MSSFKSIWQRHPSSAESTIAFFETLGLLLFNQVIVRKHLTLSVVSFNSTLIAEGSLSSFGVVNPPRSAQIEPIGLI
jgi:hypothetical protein